MEREAHYLTADLIREISKLNLKIESDGCRQMGLLRVDMLAELTRKNKTSDFNKEAITKLWQLGFIRADVVQTTTEVDIEGLVLIDHDEKDNLYYYADERTLQEKPEGYGDAFIGLPDLPEGTQLFFHPFRCYVLYHINRTFKFQIHPIQTITNSKWFDKLISLHVEHFNSWTSKPESIQLFNHWNNVTSLCAISETTAHRAITRKVSSRPPDDFKTTVVKLRKLQEDVNSIYKSIGENSIEYYRGEICIDAEIIDPNKDLHLIIRLMKESERSKLTGYISGAMLFLNLAECLRRNLEKTYKKKYPEEDEMGFGEVFQKAKLQTQGGTHVLDGDNLIANQFLRRFGLDHGMRLKIYVEGDTEYEALNTEFATNSSIQIVNLKGNFVEKQGKGIAFRESLRNDLKSAIFSLILLDGDRSDNLRVLRKAAEADEICGMLFVAKPDIEIENFTPSELAKIVYELAQEKGISNINLLDIVEATKNVKSAKEFFTVINTLSPELSRVKKGKEWGRALTRYAMNNPTSNELGDKDDRQINRIIATAYRSNSASYEFTRQNYKVDPQTGELVKR